MRTIKLNTLHKAIITSLFLHVAIISYVYAEIKTPAPQKSLPQTLSIHLITPAKAEVIKPTKQAKSKTTKPKKVKQSKIAQPLPTILPIATTKQPIEPIITTQAIPLHSSIENNSSNDTALPGNLTTLPNEVANTPTEQLKELTIIVGGQSLPFDQELYLQSILDKIKKQGENNYPKDAQGKSLKIKMIISKDGSAETHILRSSDNIEVDNKLISIINNISPFAKPVLIKQDKVIIIRTIKFE